MVVKLHNWILAVSVFEVQKTISKTMYFQQAILSFFVMFGCRGKKFHIQS